MSVGWRLRFPDVRLCFGPVALLAVLVQAFALFAPIGTDDLPRRLLLPFSYLLILFFVGANMRRPGIAIISLGVFLNFLPIVANGGLMPITPETLMQTGTVPSDVGPGDWLPGTKDIVLHREDVVLYPLTDRLAWDPLPVRGFSVGDIIIAGGLLVMLADLFLPRLERETSRRRRHPIDEPAQRHSDS